MPGRHRRNPHRSALKHGRYSYEALEFRRRMRELVREADELIQIT